MVFCGRTKKFDWLNKETDASFGLNPEQRAEDKARLVPMDYPITYEDESNWLCVNNKAEDRHPTKRPLERTSEHEPITRKLSKRPTTHADTTLTIGGFLTSYLTNDESDSSDSSSLISSIGRDNSISCLVRCSRADYGSIASLNRSFRSLVRSGELYKLRRQNGVIEHWVYFSCHLLEWEAFDPNRRRWMRLPQMDRNDCFLFADKESLAVGSELLVFGRDLMSHLIYRYSLLTNAWSTGMVMNVPRCLFGSASSGEIAILAGGCDPNGNVLRSAELYDSETRTWRVIRDMNKPRKMCSGVFMDGKFYVIGGIGGPESKLLTCGEEYDLEADTWREIPNMSLVREGGGEGEPPASSEAPPLVAVVNNDLYAADYADMKVKKYDKVGRVWRSIGDLPERADSMYGWGLAFRACGERLIVIGGPRYSGEGFIEVNSWIPSDGGPPRWDVLGRKLSASFVYNCAVMGC